MNKIAKILSAVIAVALALSMFTFALAADKAAISVSVKSETADAVVLEVVLEEGKNVGALEVKIAGKSANIGACTAIEGSKAAWDMCMGYANTCQIAAISASGVDAEAAVAEFTFEKAADADVTADDFSIEVLNCATADPIAALDCDVINNLPVAEVPTEPSTEATEPSTEATEPSTEATEPSTEATEPSTEATEPSTEATEPSTEATEPSTEATEPSTEATEPSTEATEPSTEATEPSTEATEPSTEATEPSTEDKTDAPVADDNTTTAPEAGDVVNPDTGDSVTATAAIVSLLAVSGAAIVALRKKED